MLSDFLWCIKMIALLWKKELCSFLWVAATVEQFWEERGGKGKKNITTTERNVPNRCSSVCLCAALLCISINITGSGCQVEKTGCYGENRVLGPVTARMCYQGGYRQCVCVCVSLALSSRWWIRGPAFISQRWPDNDLVLIPGWKSRFVKHGWFTENW